MKRLTVLMLLTTCATAVSRAGATPEVTIRLFDTGDVSGCTLADAEAIAAHALATAGVHVRWNGGPERGQAPPAETIDIRFSYFMSPRHKPDALAESFPFASNGVRVVVFVDRVWSFAGREPVLFPRALGYTLAHEIGHILKGTDTHSANGVMKAAWSDDDHYAIWSKSLAFSPDDAATIASRLAR